MPSVCLHCRRLGRERLKWRACALTAITGLPLSKHTLSTGASWPNSHTEISSAHKPCSERRGHIVCPNLSCVWLLIDKIPRSTGLKNTFLLFPSRKFLLGSPFHKFIPCLAPENVFSVVFPSPKHEFGMGNVALSGWRCARLTIATSSSAPRIPTCPINKNVLCMFFFLNANGSFFMVLKILCF